jgi:hypothetical protein
MNGTSGGYLAALAISISLDFILAQNYHLGDALTWVEFSASRFLGWRDKIIAFRGINSTRDDRFRIGTTFRRRDCRRYRFRHFPQTHILMLVSSHARIVDHLALIGFTSLWVWQILG